MKKKSLSAKKKIHKYLLKHLKNKRINKVFEEFNYRLDFFLKRDTGNLLSKQTKFAVAVSGGPDSLALAFLSKCFLLKNKIYPNIKFFIVDHKLRKESSTEAKSLKKFLIISMIYLKTAFEVRRLLCTFRVVFDFFSKP